MEKVAIIGAGPAGITAAYCLAKGEVPVDVYEASPDIGGLARSFELWGQRVDLGPHRFFSTEPRVNELWKEVIGDDYRRVARLTRIFYKGKFYDYPLRPLNALKNLGVIESIRCVLSYLAQFSSRGSKENTFESWVTKRFGARLFEVFFRPYSEKLWGIPCSQLDSDFAAQRIKKLDLREAIYSAFGMRNSKHHRTLIDEFAYPLAGSGELYLRMANDVQRNGGGIHLKTPVRRVIVESGQIVGIELLDGTIRPCSQVISTMPLSVLAQTISDVPPYVLKASQKLRFRNTILVYLRLRRSGLFPDQWIYIQSPELKLGRLTNFRNWVPELSRGSSDTILCCEYWCFENEARWSATDAELTEMAKSELGKTGLADPSDVVDGFVHRINRCYPVYECGYHETVKIVSNYLKEIVGLQVIGRYGSFKYNNQDHSILMGILAADNILDGLSHDLWQVNSDQNYQESAPLEEVSLFREPKPVEERMK